MGTGLLTVLIFGMLIVLLVLGTAIYSGVLMIFKVVSLGQLKALISGGKE